MTTSRALQGKTIDARYHVGEVLRETRRTTVFAAVDTRVGSRLEIEVLTADDDAWSPSARALELRAAMNAEIAHPAVPMPRDVGLLEDGSPYVVRPEREGMTLEDRVCLGGPLAVGDVIRIGVELLSALSAAHEKNLKHGAIAPERVIVIERDAIVLGAKLDDFGADSPKVDDHSTLGFSRLAFVAPERLDAATTAEAAPTIASDLFALAAVLHFASTGTSPMTARRGAGAFGLMPARLSRALLRAMHPEPEHRYSSAQEMIGMLLALRDLPPGEMIDDVAPATRRARPEDGAFARQGDQEHTSTLTSTDIRRIAVEPRAKAG